MVKIVLALLVVLLVSCSGDAEYALLDAYERDTGHRMKMTTNKENVHGIMIVKDTYDDKKNEQFVEVPFEGELNFRTNMILKSKWVKTPNPNKKCGASKIKIGGFLRKGRFDDLHSRGELMEYYQENNVQKSDFFFGNISITDSSSKCLTGTRTYSDMYIVPLKNMHQQ